MAGTRQEHGRNTAGTWQEHGRNMAGTWQEHGRNTTGQKESVRADLLKILNPRDAREFKAVKFARRRRFGAGLGRSRWV